MPPSSVVERAPVETTDAPAAARELDPARLGDHFDRLFRAAWALCGSREDVEALVQETYAQVLRKRLSYGEAAKALRTREATITTRLYRARQRLARALGGKESDPVGVMTGKP